MPTHNGELKDVNIATELLREAKAQAKRWMIAFFVVLSLWIGVIITFAWFLHQNNF